MKVYGKQAYWPCDNPESPSAKLTAEMSDLLGSYLAR